MRIAHCRAPPSLTPVFSVLPWHLRHIMDSRDAGPWRHTQSMYMFEPNPALHDIAICSLVERKRIRSCVGCFWKELRVLSGWLGTRNNGTMLGEERLERWRPRCRWSEGGRERRQEFGDGLPLLQLFQAFSQHAQPDSEAARGTLPRIPSTR